MQQPVCDPLSSTFIRVFLSSLTRPAGSRSVSRQFSFAGGGVCSFFFSRLLRHAQQTHRSSGQNEPFSFCLVLLLLFLVCLCGDVMIGLCIFSSPVTRAVEQRTACVAADALCGGRRQAGGKEWGALPPSRQLPHDRGGVSCYP